MQEPLPPTTEPEVIYKRVRRGRRPLHRRIAHRIEERWRRIPPSRRRKLRQLWIGLLVCMLVALVSYASVLLLNY